jgi:hypothetical protein
MEDKQKLQKMVKEYVVTSQKDRKGKHLKSTQTHPSKIHHNAWKRMINWYLKSFANY